ncbi:REP-associated tyrosine transposase [Rubinisphaera brasiliensis]|uniref:Transposase n=1 Tax=Rubinisphaera brasiliensis (strain ATCC 49424 / DSM 5305 / JCM 21570 / IAM 15109 / NBRC 103401 / IFAM 1448) TaxID=756272 RepID=F0SNH4_RUBBR|nr:transposase [Rubinisphaera brasiliensis]ADY57808.1 transposase [Rubinisphaera brasiliensis DSM 5305]
MRQYIRSREGSIFFFTLVTHERQPILTSRLGRRCLHIAIKAVRAKRPFEIIGIVLLPDHLHALWELPRGDNDYSTRWRLIKTKFTKQWLAESNAEGQVNRSRTAKNERGLWQRRFFEHTCRDEADATRCLTYIHANPLKHGLVERVVDWPWSSFHRYVKQGIYSPDWGSQGEWHGDEFQNAE